MLGNLNKNNNHKYVDLKVFLVSTLIESLVSIRLVNCASLVYELYIKLHLHRIYLGTDILTVKFNCFVLF